MTKSKIFLFLCLFFIAGAITASFFEISVLVPGFLSIFSVFSASLFWRENKKAVFALSAAFFLCLGYFHFYFFQDGFGLSQNSVYLKISSALESVKTEFESSLNHSLPEPEASFASGILLGSKQKIPKKLRNDFKITGTSHVLAISGYNITVIAGALGSIFLLFQISQPAGFWLTSAILGAFAVLTGASPSIVRAAIMGVLALFARKNGRIYSSINALVFVGALMVFFEPKILRFDLAFQLSFLATSGIILISPIIEEKLKKLPDFLKLKENLIMTISAQAAVLPLIVFKFGSLSLVSFLINALILPAMPVSMFFSFVAGAFGLFSALLGRFFGWFAEIPLKYTIKMIELGANVPFASLEIKSFSPALFVLSYALIIFFIWKNSQKKQTRENTE